MEVKVSDMAWDLYNAKREKVGELEYGKILLPGQYHLVVAAWIKNSQGQFLLTQRHPDKNYPYYWECTGGSAMAGESSIEVAIREVNEELGVLLHVDRSFLFYQSVRDEMYDIYDAWLFRVDVPISSLRLRPTEVIDAKWVDKDSLYDMYVQKKIHPKIDYIDLLLNLD